MTTVSDSGVGLTPELLHRLRNRGAVTGQAAATSASQVRERILVLRQRGHRGGATPVPCTVLGLRKWQCAMANGNAQWASHNTEV